MKVITWTNPHTWVCRLHLQKNPIFSSCPWTYFPNYVDELTCKKIGITCKKEHSIYIPELLWFLWTVVILVKTPQKEVSAPRFPNVHKHVSDQHTTETEVIIQCLKSYRQKYMYPTVLYKFSCVHLNEYKQNQFFSYQMLKNYKLVPYRKKSMVLQWLCRLLIINVL